MNKFQKIDAVAIGEFHPLFKGLMWVAAARSTDETRYAITTINVERAGEEWKLVATDGRRLHVATFDAGLFSDDLQMIEVGLWEVITKTNKLIVIAPAEMSTTYPDWRAIMPPPRPFYREQVSANTTSKLGVRTGVLLNSAFVADAIGFGTVVKKTDNADIEFSADPSGDGPFMIRHEVGTSVVMPMRIDEAEEHEAREEEDTGTDDLPGFVDAMGALTKAMEVGDTLEISAGGKRVGKIRKAQGGLEKVDEEI